MSKEKEIENKSLEDLKNIVEYVEASGLNIIVIGGYAVRAYTATRLRYSKDIDLSVDSQESLQKLKNVLGKLGYKISEKPHGISGFKRHNGTPIVLNISIDELDFQKMKITSFYGENYAEANVVCIEELLILKAIAGREKDIIDICITLLDSFPLLDKEKLNQKLIEKNCKEEFLQKMKFILDNLGSNNFKSLWGDFLGRKIEKNEETELWEKLSGLVKI